MLDHNLSAGLGSGLSSGTNADEFRFLARKVSERAARFGKKVVGYHDPALPLFSAAAPAQQNKILDSLRILNESLDNDDEEIFFEAEKRALWKSTRILGLVPPAELFNELKPNRAIEIFGLDGGLLWRNLACMDLCSYTLEEIACIDVFERYERAPEVYEQCVANLQAMLSGAIPEVSDPGIAAYTIVETKSSDQLVLSIKHELGAVLKNRQGVVNAWLVMSDARVMGTNAPPPEAEPRNARLSIVSH